MVQRGLEVASTRHGKFAFVMLVTLPVTRSLVQRNFTRKAAQTIWS